MSKISIMNPNSSSSILTIALLVIVLSIGSLSELGFSREFGIVRLKQLGGETPNFSNSDEFESIARFAVQEYNKRENALLRLGRVLTAKEQVVAGKLYHLTFEAVDAGKKAVYEAKVWVKPWINSKKLEEFKHIMDSPHFTTSDLGFVQDVLGWHKVLVHDPEVQAAAKHAVMGLQNRVNCICKFKLLEILEAEAKVVNNLVNYSLLLKLRMSGRDENYKVNVRKTEKGFLLDGW